MTELYQIHMREQLDAHWRDFLTEWAEWPRKLAGAGMNRSEIEELKLRCWHQYLVRKRFLVDDFSERA